MTYKKRYKKRHKRKLYRTVPNTKGTARFYAQRIKSKTFKHKLSLPKHLGGRYRHLYIKRKL